MEKQQIEEIRARAEKQDTCLNCGHHAEAHQYLDEAGDSACCLCDCEAMCWPGVNPQDIPVLLDYIDELEAENELQRVHIAKLGEQYNSAIDWGNTLRGMLAKYEPYRGHPSRGKGRQQ